MSKPVNTKARTVKGKHKVKIFKGKKKNKESETSIISKLQTQYENICPDGIESFKDFPLSQKTLKGLISNNYKKPTEIQRDSIGLALGGADILGAAITGSGKTLAFLIPVLETLYCQQWSHLDGLGALIITPTRELAYQIFETLRKIGKHHEFSAGLIIGGKDLHFEKKRMDQCNIMICTPGRLLQHMDENPLFNCDNMKILILDEADRCLDMGFEQTMNAIIANLPTERQTLLFSATQTKSVKDLARLSLKDPKYVSVNENTSTPAGLQQSYVVCDLHEKMTILWSFIKNHLKHKCLIFLSSCKQVKYTYEIFCKLRPGTSLLALYGSLHQLKRLQIYEEFSRKSNAVLFATDIAARGVDFPEVDWVIQADCPEDADTYIHRAGRTARYHKRGESLLILLPSEENAMVQQLEAKKIPIKSIKININKLQNPQRKMEAFLARHPLLKETAQRAFVAYAKSVFLMKNKAIFNVHALDTNAFATSLGLAVPPRIRFLQKLNKNQMLKDEPAPDLEMKSSDESDSDNDDDAREFSTSKVQEKDKQGYDFNIPESGSDEDILKIKRQNHEIEVKSDDEPIEINERITKKQKKPLTKAAVAKRLIKKKIVANTKTVFDESGDIVSKETKEKQSDLAKEYEKEDAGGIDIEKAKLVLREEDKFDKHRFRQKVKEKHRTEKQKIKQAKKDELEGERDDFGTDSDSDGPDLSWLPDPNKIYGNKQRNSAAEESADTSDSNGDGNNLPFNTNEENGSDSDVNDNINESKIHRPNKRKLVIQDHKRSKLIKIANTTDSLSVNEAEELALRLLGK